MLLWLLLFSRSGHVDAVICNIWVYKIQISLLDIRTVIIRYLQRRNEPILNAFKNNFDPFLVFLSCFENII
jgi:hypothetical protein